MGIWDKFWSWMTDESPSQATPQQKATSTATLANPEAEGESCDAENDILWWQPSGDTLTQLAGIPIPELTPEAVAIENLLVSYFDGHDLNMPPLSHVTERVLKLLRSKKSSMAKISETLSEDPVLAASILRMANCPLYRGLSKITAVTPAATRLGAKAVNTLMMHESLRSTMFPGNKGNETNMAERLWSRSLVSAHVMRALSRFTKVDEEDAYLLGLLHDIGCVVVLRIILNDKTVSSFDPDENTFEYLCAECHQEFGELIATEWNLPDDVKAIITDHHSFPSDEDPLRMQRLQLQLTDMIVSLQHFKPFYPYDLLNTDVVKALNLNTQPNFVSFLENVPSIIDDAFASF